MSEHFVRILVVSLPVALFACEPRPDVTEVDSKVEAISFDAPKAFANTRSDTDLFGNPVEYVDVLITDESDACDKVRPRPSETLVLFPDMVVTRSDGTIVPALWIQGTNTDWSSSAVVHHNDDAGTRGGSGELDLYESVDDDTSTVRGHFSAAFPDAGTISGSFVAMRCEVPLR